MFNGFRCATLLVLAGPLMACGAVPDQGGTAIQGSPIEDTASTAAAIASYEGCVRACDSCWAIGSGSTQDIDGIDPQGGRIGPQSFGNRRPICGVCNFCAAHGGLDPVKHRPVCDSQCYPGLWACLEKGATPSDPDAGPAGSQTDCFDAFKKCCGP
jgi:hypothetical protein